MVVVFFEYVGIWLVVSGEKFEVYVVVDWFMVMDWMVVSNLLKVVCGWIIVCGDQCFIDILFWMKVVDMVYDYQILFGGFVYDFKVMVVVGFIVLFDFEVEDGELCFGIGQLYNVSLIFGFDGWLFGQL